MNLLKELHIFIESILYWICSFIVASFFFFIFGIEKTILWGKSYYLPLPSENSFSVQIFNKISHDLLPSGVELIATNPMSGFVAQMYLSLLLGFLFTIPYFIYKMVAYLHPALLPREKRAVFWSLFPFVILFFSGCLFSYLYLIPATFRILYPFATVMGVTPFFSLDEFIQYVLGICVAVGLMFLLPLFMILLSFLNIIKAEFWIQKWRFALLFFLALSAIITPDGTGITMVMLFVPLVALYFAGCFFAKKTGEAELIKKVE